MFSYLLPASLQTWISDTVKATVTRWKSITDRKLDLMEAELSQREAFAGIAPAPVNRIADTNGKRKARA